MTEQIQRDRLEDAEKWLEKWAALRVDIAMMKVAIKRSVSKGHLSDEMARQLERMQKEQDKAMAELRNEMQATFADAIEDAFNRHADAHRKQIKLYTRIGALILLVVLAKDAGSLITMAKLAIGLP